MAAALVALRRRWLLRWMLLALAPVARALVELPPIDEGGGEGYVDGRKPLRYVADPDQTSDAVVCERICPLFGVGLDLRQVQGAR